MPHLFSTLLLNRRDHFGLLRRWRIKTKEIKLVLSGLPRIEVYSQNIVMSLLITDCVPELYSYCQLTSKRKDFKFIVPNSDGQTLRNWFKKEMEWKCFVFFILNFEDKRIEKSRN